MCVFILHCLLSHFYFIHFSSSAFLYWQIKFYNLDFELVAIDRKHHWIKNQLFYTWQMYLAFFPKVYISVQIQLWWDILHCKHIYFSSNRVVYSQYVFGIYLQWKQTPFISVLVIGYNDNFIPYSGDVLMLLNVDCWIILFAKATVYFLFMYP